MIFELITSVDVFIRCEWTGWFDSRKFCSASRKCQKFHLNVEPWSSICQSNYLRISLAIGNTFGSFVHRMATSNRVFITSQFRCGWGSRYVNCNSTTIILCYRHTRGTRVCGHSFRNNSYWYPNKIHTLQLRCSSQKLFHKNGRPNADIFCAIIFSPFLS